MTKVDINQIADILMLERQSHPYNSEVRVALDNVAAGIASMLQNKVSGFNRSGFMQAVLGEVRTAEESILEKLEKQHAA